MRGEGAPPTTASQSLADMAVAQKLLGQTPVPWYWRWKFRAPSMDALMAHRLKTHRDDPVWGKVLNPAQIDDVKLEVCIMCVSTQR